MAVFLRKLVGIGKLPDEKRRIVGGCAVARRQKSPLVEGVVSLDK